MSTPTGVAAWRGWPGRLLRPFVPALGRDSALRRGAWAALLVLALAAIFVSASLPGPVQLKAGQAAPSTIKAPHDFIDGPTTDAMRAAAAARVGKVYRIDDGLMQQSLAQFDSAVAAVGGARRAPGLTLAQRQALLAPQLPPGVPAADQTAVLGTSAETLATATADARAAASAALSSGVRPGDLASTQESLAAQIRRLPYAPAVDDFFARLAAATLVADDLEDPAATARAQQAAAAAVPPTVVVAGEVIVREGDIVTPADLSRLQEAGVLRQQGWPVLAGGALAAAALLVGLGWGFLRLHATQVLRRERTLALFGMIGVGAVALERLLLPVSPYLVPAAAGAMLYAVAFSDRAALVGAALLAAAAAILSRNAGVGLSVLAGALAAGYGVGALHHRRDLVRAGLYAAGAAAVAVLAQALLSGGAALSRQQLLPAGLFAAGSGVLSGVLAVGCLTYIEDFFDILTPVRLLELGNPNQPLLNRLVVEAPGTYHHSLMVGNLAEAAAQAIGANALLVRVGALYHDVGKLKRPFFFIENQFGADNPHDRLSPSLSALVITSHVKEGVELAREQHLPQEIVDLIRTHHGTQMVTYFYERARQADDGTGVLETNFRYSGPLPSTREQAILMLADGVEAAVRAAHTTDIEEIEQIARRMVRERLDGGQLDHAALTLGDIDTITQTFCRVLRGMHHARIAYPEQVARELRRGSERDGSELVSAAKRPGGQAARAAAAALRRRTGS